MHLCFRSSLVCRYLVSFPRYLQQLEMESNGQAGTEKRRTRHLWKLSCHLGKCRNQWATCLFSVTASGNRNHSCRFPFVALSPHHTLAKHHSALLANCFAQSEALMKGKTADQVRADLEASGMSPQEIETQIPQRTFPGNRPSNTILMNVLQTRNAGRTDGTI